MSSYVDAISQATTATTANTTTNSTTESVMGKEDFLSLLVAQLQNQDPLNPDDPTEFTAQLAQFSQLEQLFTLNESMESLVSSNTNSDRLSTLTTIGKDVSYQTSTINFSGEPIDIGYQLDGQASSVTLSLQNNGATVATFQAEELSAGAHYINWDGLTSEGYPATPGEYKLIIQAQAAAGTDIEALTLVRSEVTGVDLGGEKGGLLLTKAGEIAFNSILGVYEPDSKIPANSQSGDEEDETASDSTADTIASVENITENVSNTVNN